MHRRSEFYLLLVELLFVVIGVLYVASTPLWTPADEERHFAYCQFIAQQHSLPVFRSDFQQNSVYMAFHPPLYYLLGSLFCSADAPLLEEQIRVHPGPGNTTLVHPPEQVASFSGTARSAYLLRLVSLLLGALTIWFAFRCVAIVFPNEPAIGIAAVLFVAMNPEFMHVSASISNENLSTTLASGCVFLLLRYLQRPYAFGGVLAIGVILGCALLTKTSNLFLVPLAVCLCAYLMIQRRPRAGRDLLLIMFVAAMISAWWYMRNWIQFDDPVFAKAMAAAHPWSVRHTLPTLHDTVLIIEKAFISYFGYFGGLKVPLPWSLLIWYALLLLGGVVGLLCMCLARRITRDVALPLVLLLLALLGGASIFVLFNLKYKGAYSGRYLFVVIVPVTILVFQGLKQIVSRRWSRQFFLMICALLLILNLCALFGVLRPGYAEPRLARVQQQDLFDCSTPAIVPGSGVSQGFVAPADNLCGIELLFAARPRPRAGQVGIALIDAPTERELYAVTVPAAEIEDFARYYFVFPPIAQSGGQRYRLRLTSAGIPASSHVGVWYSEDDAYPAGRLCLNGDPVAGDLYFILYCFTGAYPESEWEGLYPCARKIGLYLDVWEMQLYQERTQSFREQSPTHQKLLRIEEAYRRRNQGCGARD